MLHDARMCLVSCMYLACCAYPVRCMYAACCVYVVCRLHVVWCMYAAGMLHVRCMYSTCMLHIACVLHGRYSAQLDLLARSGLRMLPSQPVRVATVLPGIMSSQTCSPRITCSPLCCKKIVLTQSCPRTRPCTLLEPDGTRSGVGRGGSLSSQPSSSPFFGFNLSTYA